MQATCVLEQHRRLDRDGAHWHPCPFLCSCLLACLQPALWLRRQPNGHAGRAGQAHAAAAGPASSLLSRTASACTPAARQLYAHLLVNSHAVCAWRAGCITYILSTCYGRTHSVQAQWEPVAAAWKTRKQTCGVGPHFVLFPLQSTAQRLQQLSHFAFTAVLT